MSKYVFENLKCPHCGNSQESKVYTSINVTEDPNLKKLIMTNEFNIFNCNKCKNTYPIMNNFIYHDMKNKYMIYLLNSAAEKQLPAGIGVLFDDYRLRIVSGRNELIEKIRIFDDVKSDFLVELLKIILSEDAHNAQDSHNGFEVYYNGFKNGIMGKKSVSFLQIKEHFIKEHKLDLKRTPKELIEKYSDPMLIPNSTWLVVDQDFILSKLEFEGAIRKLDMITVHILDPNSGYNKTNWEIGVDISPEKYEQYKDHSTGDIYVLYIVEPIKELNQNEVDDFDSLIDIINKKINVSPSKKEFVSKELWLKAKEKFDSMS